MSSVFCLCALLLVTASALRLLPDIGTRLFSTSLDSSTGGVDVLTTEFAALSELIGGSGKAKTIWMLLRNGIDPTLDYTDTFVYQMRGLDEASGTSDGLDKNLQFLSVKAREYLKTNLLGSSKSIVPLAVKDITVSDCGTRKLLVQLESDNQLIESVLIPSYKYDRTTLCVSTQIGCDRGCTFCATGTMGLVRNLTASEIVGQVIKGKEYAIKNGMPALTNIVLMGMGDSGRNADNVGLACNILTDRSRMSMAQAKITISTVGPSPETFMQLAGFPGTLAWSLHSPDDIIRRKLVPSTRHTTVALRDGLVRALESRPAIRMRTIMIALTLIDGINDSEEDALKLSKFIQPMLATVPKIAIDLIPYNDINAHGFKRPSMDKVNAFQAVLRDNGFFCSVRVTRGDEESSACGMLVTEKKRMKSTPSQD